MSSSSPSASISGERQPLAVILTDLETHQRGRWLERASWAFMGLGVLLRIARYLMDYPLWWDEAFVAVNFIRRDYFDLLRPLDYGQVCPILFLWCELAAVKLLGFSEWSLRLFPLVCAIASVVVFRHVAGRVMRGLPLLLAVAIFATSFHPILHAADVKPYASDLLAALILLAIAVEWWRAPEEAGWMWAMAAMAPVALALSHPAIFVASGIVLGLAPAVVKAHRRGVSIAYAAFVLNTGIAFVALYLIFTRAQATANLTAMQTQWFAAFPPLSNPLALLKWLASAHTGSMFAYPCGGERGASSLTFSLFVVGVGVLWYRGKRTIVLTCLAPFAMALAAAALRRYPYGGPVAHGSPARVMQYLAPGICLLAGLGAASVLALFRNPQRRRRIVQAILIFLAAVGVIPLAADAFHPYRAVHAQRARQFARRFWPEFARDADSVCLRWDLGIGEWDSTNLNVAVYLCNQMIYSPQRRHPRERSLQNVSASRPLRCVAPLADPADRRVAGWLDGMKKRYQLRECRTLAVDMAEPGAKLRTENYSLYEFVPRQVASHDRGQGNRIGVDRPVSSALELMQVSRPKLLPP
jgi:4-amino-4-deoxy-L-arabinose transferase-like glycosyltransferase